MSEEANREFGRKLFGQPPEADTDNRPRVARPPSPDAGTEAEPTEAEPTKRGETAEQRFNESTLAALRGPAHKTEADRRFFDRLHGAQTVEDVERKQGAEEAEGSDDE